MAGVKGAEVAMALSPGPGARVTTLPTWSLVEMHAWGVDVGPHAKMVTVPVGLPELALPVTVAVSVLLFPNSMIELSGELVVPVTLAPLLTVNVKACVASGLTPLEAVITKG